MTPVSKLVGGVAKAITVIILFCIILFLFSFCSFEYNGEHEDLYSVAVNTVFGVSGNLSNGEVLYNPEIHIVETDSFGRTLFFYSENYGESVDSIFYDMAFVVMQQSRDGYAYYYRDVCYIPHSDTTCDFETIFDKMDGEYLQALKAANDWNCELDESACARVKISNRKPEGKIKPRDYELDEIIYPYKVKNGYTGEDDSFCKYARFCESDDYGRELFHVSASTWNTDENGEDIYDYYHFAIILNADGSCCENGIIEIKEFETILADLNRLKQNAGWNKAA